MRSEFVVVLVVLSILSHGCAQGGRRGAKGTPTQKQVGCYRLLIDSADFGDKDVYPLPPDQIELRSEAISSDLHRGYSLRAPVVPPRTVAYWFPEEGDGLVLYWGRDFSGLRLTLKPNVGGYEGVAETVSDVEQPITRSNVRMVRVPCW